MADGRQTNGEIAEKIGLTKEVVKKNYEKMEQIGVITGATIHINYKSFGYKAVAHILITVDPQQEDNLIKYLKKMPEVFSFYGRGIKGNIDVVTILKTLEQLNEFKDAIKRNFSISEMRTAIWTDVKETNENLAIISDAGVAINSPVKTPKKSSPQTIVIDEVDQKIVDKLSENGRISMESLGREIGISSNCAKKRYEKMRKNGALKVTIQINPIKIGYQALCVFFIAISNEESLSFIDKISKMPDVISIMKTTGDYDLQVWAMVKDVGQLLCIQEELGNIPQITEIHMELLRVRDKWPTPRQYISTF